MSTYQDLVEALQRVRDATGDPRAWMSGLTPGEVSAVVSPATGPEQLDAIVRKIHQQHPDLFNPGTATPREPPATPPASGEPPPDRQQGEAAKAIADAEAALAHQNSASSQLDLQVISAILNAHLKTVQGRAAMTKLQQETETALRTRSDLDTPAGARDFQRFLIGKLRDIRAVVADASLDDTSKSALMAAWTSLYDASKSGARVPGEVRPASTIAAGAPARGGGPDPSDAGFDPYLGSLLAGDPGLPAGESPAQAATAAPATPAAPMTPVLPGIPNFGGGLAPGGGSMPGWSTPPAGLTLPEPLGGRADEPRLTSEDPDPHDHAASEDPRTEDHVEKDPPPETPPSPPEGPTTVTLPNGETVTAASPQLAAAIKAAAAGASIPDAFQQQGITIPPPGTAVTHPIEPALVAPGDIGMLTDRHALALGHSKALLDGQIQHIATVSGPSFLGWEHPPTPAHTEPPTPTRPAATSAGWAR